MKKNTLIQSLAIAAALLVGCGGGEPEPAAPIVPETPDIDLITASAENKIDVVKQHIAAGTDLDQKDPNPNGVQTTSLGIAAAFGYTEVAKALIDGGADVNVPDKNGSTPLHTAAFMCHAEIVQALVAKGADKSARNNSGGTALESVDNGDERSPVGHDPLPLDREVCPVHIVLGGRRVEDLRGDGDHYLAHVVADAFAGKTRVQQHQMVYQALQGRMGEELHALALQTAPRES